jgi:hypothetical protein
MSRAPARRRPLTLGEHFFWTVIVTVAVCFTVAVCLAL